MKDDKPVQVGEQLFRYKVGNTLIGVWEVERVYDTARDRRGRERPKCGGACFTAPCSDEWLDRTRVHELILRKILN